MKFKKKEDKKSVAKGLTYLGGSAVVGQQTIRSGIPRLLGVRLESHSTNRKNAKEILNNGGWIDPNKSGSSSVKFLEVLEDLPNTTKVSDAKGKTYITGIHKDANSRVRPTLTGGEKIFNPKNDNLFKQIAYRKVQRTYYRAQANINWDYINKDQKQINQLQNEVKNLTDEKELLTKNKLIKDLKAKAIQRLDRERGKSLLVRAIVPTSGRSLYIGGGDEYFNKTFKPDFDDVGAMYSEKKIKVHGNRASATMEALKREGKGSRLKGAIKLIKSNPSRSLAGAGILTVGSIVTAKLWQAAYKNLVVSDGKVKGFTRKNKSGKWSNVKSFIRKKLKKD